MFDYTYSSIVDQPDIDQIRLLSLAPSQDWTDAIRVRLLDAVLSSDLKYEALSYCWGDASNKTLIACDGQPFPISENLELALRHLRHAETERILWIDAICINQKDDIERAHQVGLMRNIYGNAEMVLVWLGDADGDSDLVFDICERMVATRFELLADDTITDFQGDDFLWGANKSKIVKKRMEDLRRRQAESQAQNVGSEVRRQQGHTGPYGDDNVNGYATSEPPNLTASGSLEPSPGQSTDDFNNSEDTSDDTSDATGEEIAAILRLIDRPWFTRCWVLQEAVLGKEVQIICGTKSMDWMGFYLGFTLAVLFGDKGLQGRPEQILSGGLIFMTLMRIQTQTPETPPTSHFDILWLLQKARTFAATDPRDKVYSLLGLIPKEDASRLGITPDYSIGVEECYTRTAVAVMTYMSNLDVLLTDHQANRPFQLPSWVPDWSVLQRPAPVALLQEADDNFGQIPENSRFAASKVLKWTPDINRTTNTLILSGYTFDRLVQVEELLTVPQVDFLDMNDGMSSVHQFARMGKHLITGLGSYFDTLVKWETLALSKEFPTYPTGDDPELAYGLTMCVGAIPEGPELGLPKFRRWRETLRAPRKLGFLKSIGMNGSFYKSLTGLTGIVSGRRNIGDRVFATATEKTLYRRLARTEKGYLALVPSESKVGDCIALVKAGKTPFVMRQVREDVQWELIGPSYVHGLMCGEQWDIGQCKELFVV